MLITLSRLTAICQSVAEVNFTVVAPLGAVNHRFNLINIYKTNNYIWLQFLKPQRYYDSLAKQIVVSLK